MENKKKIKRNKKYRFKHRTIIAISSEHFGDNSQRNNSGEDCSVAIK